MPYPQPFIRVTLLGRFGTATGNEVWTTHLKIGNLTDTTDPTDFLAAIAPAAKSFHENGAVGAGTACFLTELHGAVIGTDGKYIGGAEQATKIYTLPTPGTGTGVTVMPWPTAMVLALRVSSLGRGPASHGRMYYPCTSNQVTAATGRWSSAITAAYAPVAATFLKAVNTAAGASFGPGSRIVNTSKVGAGKWAAIDRVLCGDRPDHQERRENSVSEAYAVATV